VAVLFYFWGFFCFLKVFLLMHIKVNYLKFIVSLCAALSQAQ